MKGPPILGTLVTLIPAGQVSNARSAPRADLSGGKFPFEFDARSKDWTLPPVVPFKTLHQGVSYVGTVPNSQGP